MNTIQTILSIAMCLFAGLMMTRLLRKLKLPDVTSYLIAGVLIGAYCLGRFTLGGFSFGFNNEVSPVESFSIISNVALGFIAFDIGNEFRLSDLKRTGKKATVIGIIQAVVATLMVDAALIGGMAVIILGGTILAFTFYMRGIRLVGPIAGNVLSATEPVAAVIISVLILGVAFTAYDFLGFLLILLTVPLIAVGQNREEKAKKGSL